MSARPPLGSLTHPTAEKPRAVDVGAALDEVDVEVETVDDLEVEVELNAELDLDVDTEVDAAELEVAGRLAW